MWRGGRRALLVFRLICTDGEAMQRPGEDTAGNLRVALNALVRVSWM